MTSWCLCGSGRPNFTRPTHTPHGRRARTVPVCHESCKQRRCRRKIKMLDVNTRKRRKRQRCSGRNGSKSETRIQHHLKHHKRDVVPNNKRCIYTSCRKKWPAISKWRKLFLVTGDMFLRERTIDIARVEIRTRNLGWRLAAGELDMFSGRCFMSQGFTNNTCTCTTACPYGYEVSTCNLLAPMEVPRSNRE